MAVEKIGEWCKEQPQGNTYQVKTIADNLVGVASQCVAACDRINGIVTNLRRFAQLDRADVQRVHIHSGIESAIHLLRHEFSGIELVTEFGELPEIDCAPRELNQLFMNLLLNAREATAETGKPGVIRIRTWPEGDTVKIRISDNGCGIAPENLNKIFDPGFTTKGVRVGTGLGLAICYQIVRAHQGRIEVESRPGEGTAFTVTLPVRFAG